MHPSLRDPQQSVDTLKTLHQYFLHHLLQMHLHWYMQLHATAHMPKNASIHVFGNCSGRCCSQRCSYTWSLSINHWALVADQFWWGRGRNLKESNPKTRATYHIQSFSIGISEKKICSCDTFQQLKWVEGLWGLHLLGWRPIFHSISNNGLIVFSSVHYH